VRALQRRDCGGDPGHEEIVGGTRCLVVLFPCVAVERQVPVSPREEHAFDPRIGDDRLESALREAPATSVERLTVTRGLVHAAGHEFATEKSHELPAVAFGRARHQAGVEGRRVAVAEQDVARRLAPVAIAPHRVFSRRGVEQAGRFDDGRVAVQERELERRPARIVFAALARPGPGAAGAYDGEAPEQRTRQRPPVPAEARRSLDEAPGQCGQGEGDGNECQPPCGRVDPLGRDVQERQQRPVPQVERIAHEANPDDRLGGCQDAVHPRAGARDEGERGAKHRKQNARAGECMRLVEPKCGVENRQVRRHRGGVSEPRRDFGPRALERRHRG
jgi:hypothetical protein